MSLLQMSLYGAVMILAVILIRALSLHRMPKKILLLLWGMVLLRLLIPFHIPFGCSLYSLLPFSVAAQTEDLPAASAADKNEPDTLIQQITAQKQLLQNTTAQPSPGTLTDSDSSAFVSGLQHISLQTLLWFVGMVCFAFFFAGSYRRCYRRFQTSLPLTSPELSDWLAAHPLKRPLQLRQSDEITAPLTYGILHPVILLPKHGNPEAKEQQMLILEHEYTHIRRFDTLTKLFMVAALCLHWFNPLVWLMYLLFNRDIELACDEQIILQSNTDVRSAYAHTLIQMEEHKLHFAPLCNSFCKNNMEERITAIMKTRKATVGIQLAGALLLLTVVFTLMTSASPAHGEASSENQPLPTPHTSPGIPPTSVPTVTPPLGPTATPTPTPIPTLVILPTTGAIPTVTPEKAGKPSTILTEGTLYGTALDTLSRFRELRNFLFTENLPTEESSGLAPLSKHGTTYYPVSAKSLYTLPALEHYISSLCMSTVTESIMTNLLGGEVPLLLEQNGRLYTRLYSNSSVLSDNYTVTSVEYYHEMFITLYYTDHDYQDDCFITLVEIDGNWYVLAHL